MSDRHTLQLKALVTATERRCPRGESYYGGTLNKSQAQNAILRFLGKLCILWKKVSHRSYISARSVIRPWPTSPASVTTADHCSQTRLPSPLLPLLRPISLRRLLYMPMPGCKAPLRSRTYPQRPSPSWPDRLRRCFGLSQARQNPTDLGPVNNHCHSVDAGSPPQAERR